MPRCHKNHNPMLPVRLLKQGYRSSTLDEIASMGNTRTVTEPDFQNHKPRIKKINCAKKKRIMHLAQCLFHSSSSYPEKTNILYYERCH